MLAIEVLLVHANVATIVGTTPFEPCLLRVFGLVLLLPFYFDLPVYCVSRRLAFRIFYRTRRS